MEVNTQNVIATQVTAGAIIAFVSNALQKSKYFPWITQETKTITALLKVAMSAGAALGVNMAWNGADHTLVISGLSLLGIVGAGWALAKQYVFQHLASQVMYPEPATPAKPVAPPTS